jgi:osomolarity two-component system, response regulator SSK1
MAKGDLMAKVQAKFSRQSAAASSLSSAEREPQLDHSRKNTWSLRPRGSHKHLSALASGSMEQRDARVGVVDPELPKDDGRQLVQGRVGSDRRETTSASQSRSKQLELNNNNTNRNRNKQEGASSADGLTLNTDLDPAPEEYDGEHEFRDCSTPIQSSRPSSKSNSKPSGPTRKQSLLPYQQTALIKTLLGPGDISSPSRAEGLDYAAYNVPSLSASMVSRKIWVKRPGASATLVTILEDHLVDDVRDMILKKYANTLGRSFDAPDVTLRIVPRENRQERTLGPEEPMCQILDAYFPGGQTVEEALVIDVPLRRTPRPSPQSVPRYYQEEERRPAEAASDYFPPMPVPTMPSPHLPGMVPTSVQAYTQTLTPIASLAFYVGPDYWSCT